MKRLEIRVRARMRTKLVYESESACEINRERLHEREYKLGCNLKLETFFSKETEKMARDPAWRHPLSQ